MRKNADEFLVQSTAMNQMARNKTIMIKRTKIPVKQQSATLLGDLSNRSSSSCCRNNMQA